MARQWVAQTWRGLQRVLQGNILVLSITSTLGMFGRSMAFPYLSLYILALGGQPEHIGLVNSLAPLLGLVAFPLGGYVADHVGRVKLMGWTMVASGIIQLLYVLAPSWQWLALGSLLMGLGVLQFPASSSLVADSLSPEDRSRGIALMNTLSSAPAILAPWVAGLLLDRIGVATGTRYLYAFLSVGNVISGLACMRYLHETKPPTGEGANLSLLSLLRDTYGGVPALMRRLSRSVKAQTLVMILGFLVNAVSGGFWVVYAVDHIGLTNAEWGSILLVETILRIGAMVPAGIIGDRYGRTRCIIASLLMSLIGLPLFVLVQGYWATLAVRALFGLAHALFMPASIALLADSVPRDVRGRVMAAIGQGGVMIGANSGGTGGPGLGYLVTVPLILASLSAGYIYDAGAALPWYVSAGLVLVALVVALLYVRDAAQAEV